MSSQSIALPSTPTAGAFASFGATISPRAASIEARLELSLDELIKERKKEVKKEKKHESVKKGTTLQHSKEPPSQNAKALKTKTAQGEKRSALVNKNRGLSAVATTSANSKEAKTPPKKKNKSQKTKPAPTTNERRTKPVTKQQKKNAKVPPPPAAAKPQAPQQQKKKKKSATPPVATQQPKNPTKQPKQQIVRVIRQQPAPPATKATASNALRASAKPRQVVRSTTTRSKIRTTIQQPQRHQPTASRATKRQAKAKAPQKSAVMNVVLPAKVARNFSSKAATRAEKVVRRVQSRKQAATSKNGAFVVRRVQTRKL